MSYSNAETNAQKIMHAATVASMIAIQGNAKAGRAATRKSDYGVSVSGSRRTFFVRIFKRSILPWSATAYASH